MKTSELKDRLWKDFKLSMILTIISGIIAIVVMIQDISWHGVLYAFLISAMYCFGLAFVCGLISSVLDWIFNWHTQTKQRLLWGIIITVTYVVSAVLLIDYQVMVKFSHLPPELFMKEKFLWMHLFYIMLSLGISTFFHAKGSMQKLKISLQEKALLEKENIASQYEALKNQTDPHFFFNSLNVLSSLIEENTQTAQEFVSKLSQIYRYILAQKDKDLVSLNEELNFAQKYLFLQKIRFEDGVNYQTDISYPLLSCHTIPLALQILLENIFKHNSISHEKPVNIRIYTQDNYLLITNNKNPKSSVNRSNGIGLENLRARYSYFSSIPISINDTPSDFTIKLPLITK